MKYQTKILLWRIAHIVLIVLFFGSCILRLASSNDSWYANNWGWFAGSFFTLFAGIYIYRTLTRRYWFFNL